MKDLTELLAAARQYADLTGDGALYLAPGVTTAEAHVAAWHAIAVQGGYATPSVEAWRLAGDKGTASREQADAALNAPGALHIEKTNYELVRKAIGDADYNAGAVARLQAPAPVAELQASEAATNDRNEFTGTDGKLYHCPYGLESLGGGAITHEGAWLDCHGCNPPVVVNVTPGFVGTIDNVLAGLRAQYDAAKAEAKAATERFDAVKSKLQTALSEATNGAYRSELRVPGFKPMTLVYTEPWTVDTKRLKAEQPAVYVEYAKRGSRWTLAESRGQ